MRTLFKPLPFTKFAIWQQMPVFYRLAVLLENKRHIFRKYSYISIVYNLGFIAFNCFN